jgi:hypothetical protein
MPVLTMELPAYDRRLCNGRDPVARRAGGKRVEGGRLMWLERGAASRSTQSPDGRQAVCGPAPLTQDISGSI